MLKIWLRFVEEFLRYSQGKSKVRGHVYSSRSIYSVQIYLIWCPWSRLAERWQNWHSLDLRWTTENDASWWSHWTNLGSWSPFVNGNFLAIFLEIFCQKTEYRVLKLWGFMHKFLGSRTHQKGWFCAHCSCILSLIPSISCIIAQAHIGHISRSWR